MEKKKSKEEETESKKETGEEETAPKEEKTVEKAVEKSEKRERVLVVPGETVATGNFLPGDGTQKDGSEIIATRFGLLEKEDKLVKVIPLSGAYIPRRGNTVIGQVTDITFNGWLMDIMAPQQAFLPVAECFGRLDKEDLGSYFTFKDMIVAKIKSIKSRGVDLTMRDAGLGKIEGGIIIKVNPTRVPRVIGRAGSMVNTIKQETGCNVIVGQNGIIWLRGKSPEDEMLAEEAIDMIVKKPFVEGLTEKIKEFLIEQKAKFKKKEAKKEVEEAK